MILLFETPAKSWGNKVDDRKHSFVPQCKEESIRNEQKLKKNYLSCALCNNNIHNRSIMINKYVIITIDNSINYDKIYAKIPWGP